MLSRRLGLYKKWYCSLSSPNVLSFVSFLSFYRSPFPMLFPFIIYFYFYHIFTIHFYLTSLLFRHLLPFTSEEHGERNLLSYGLHYSGHFLINETDKTVVYHLIRMQQNIPSKNLPYCPLNSTSFKSYRPLRIP